MPFQFFQFPFDKSHFIGRDALFTKLLHDAAAFVPVQKADRGAVIYAGLQRIQPVEEPLFVWQRTG